MKNFLLRQDFNPSVWSKGWQSGLEKYLLISDSEAKSGRFVSELEIFLDDLECSVRGEEMMKRSQKISGCLGQRHAEAMLMNQDNIPFAWQKYDLLFPRTIRGYGIYHSRHIPCLGWDKEESRWTIYYKWLFNSFGRSWRIMKQKE